MLSRRYSVYLLYWYKSTNTDAADEQATFAGSHVRARTAVPLLDQHVAEGAYAYFLVHGAHHTPAHSVFVTVHRHITAALLIDISHFFCC
jgi:hypothetical protein